MPSALAISLRLAPAMRGTSLPTDGLPMPAMPFSRPAAHTLPLARRDLIASACFWVRSPFFTASLSVWFRASEMALLTWSWLLPGSVARCPTNRSQYAWVVLLLLLGLGEGDGDAAS